jgi:hypothetical protein
MNHFLLSAELRWFFEGPVPPPVHQWFHKSLFCGKPASRTDHYLLFPHTGKLGVKFREERLEIKCLVGEAGVFFFGNAQGSIEYWEKWSSDQMPEFSASQLQSDASWIQVQKSRVLRLFEVDKEGYEECDIRSGYIQLERGCQMELTEILIRNVKYWSLGFEAFSSRKDHREILAGTMNHVFNDNECPVALTAENASSYPVLLHRIQYSS